MAKRDHLTLLADRTLPTFGRMEPRPTGFDPEARWLSVSAHIDAEFADGRSVIRRGFFAAIAQGRDDAETMNRLVRLLSSGANDEWRTSEQTAHPTPPERRLPPGSNSLRRRPGGDGR